MKKHLSVLLCLALLLTLFSACGQKTVPETPTPAAPTEPTVHEPVTEPAPSTEPEPSPAEPAKPEPIKVDRETAQKAIQQTALAYFYKNPYMQYDAHSVTFEPKFYGAGRITHYEPPEYASYDQWHYSQCTDFCCDIIYDALGYAIYDGVVAPGTVNSGIKNFVDLTGPEVVYAKRGLSGDDLKAAVDEFRSLLQPGDIVGACGFDGHMMMWLGDCLGDGTNYVIHCWGASYDDATGDPVTESVGSIKLQPEDELLFGSGGSPNWNLYLDKRSSSLIGLYRFIDAADYDGTITPQAATRLAYPNMSIDRTVDRAQYNDVVTSIDVTVTVTISNKGKEAYKGLKITETLPESGVTLKMGETEWTVDVPAGGTVKKTYTVTVTAPKGSTILFPQGKVGDIPTREIELQVGGKHLSSEQEKALLGLADVPPEIRGTGTEAIVNLYQDILGIKLDIPDADTLVSGIFKSKNYLEQKLLYVKPEISDACRTAYSMIVREHIGGQHFTAGDSITLRTTDFLKPYYQAGDIVFVENTATNRLVDSSMHTYLYLGSGKVLDIGGGSAEVTTFEKTIQRLLITNFFIVLRPTLAYDDLSKTPVPERKVEAIPVTTEAELKALTITKGLVGICGDITLTEDLALPNITLAVQKGGTLHLGDHNVRVFDVQVEEGGVLDANGSGRILVESYSDSKTKSTLEEKDGQPYLLDCYYNDIVCVYDCLTRIVLYKGDTSTGYKTLRSIFANAPDGWTVKLESGLVSNITYDIAAQNLTIDLNGNRNGARNYNGTNLKIIDSVGGGYFVIRGSSAGPTDRLNVNLDASEVTLQLGFGTNESVHLEVPTTLTYGTVNMLNGSTMTAVQDGQLIEKK